MVRTVMVVNWPEIGLIVALNAAILAGIGVLALRFLRKYVPMWAGGAIGRFWQELMQKAADDDSGDSPTGILKLGGFQIDVGTVRAFMEIAPQLIELGRNFGLIKGDSGGTFNP